MEKKIIRITVGPERYKVSVDTFNEQGRFIKNEPGIDSLRTPRNDSALASLVDSYAKLPNYIIKVSRDNGKTFESVKDLPSRSPSRSPSRRDETVGDRFLQWIPKRIAS